MIKRYSALLCFLIALLLILCSCTAKGNDVSDVSIGIPPVQSEVPEELKGFEIHFIDVGQADSALVICDGKVMMIDGGNTDASSIVYTYLTKLGISYIDVMVATHSDGDHVGGLPAALTKADVGTIYCPVTERDTSAFRTFKNKAASKGLLLTVPKVPSEFYLGSAKVRIIGPVKNFDDNNNISIVLRITYGENTFLFAGDAQRDAENLIVASGEELKSDVLKVGHHGSYTSSNYIFLREVMPTYAVISCGRNNEYGHPHEAALSRLEQCGAQILRTDISGDIICKSDGKNITFTTSGVHSIVTSYIGNFNSKVYHADTCASLPSERNRVYFETREEAEDNGYSPCPNCKP